MREIREITDDKIDLFPDYEDFNSTFRKAVEDCNGFVYHGDRLEAQIQLMKWLRKHGEEARFLIECHRPTEYKEGDIIDIDEGKFRITQVDPVTGEIEAQAMW